MDPLASLTSSFSLHAIQMWKLARRTRQRAPLVGGAYHLRYHRAPGIAALAFTALYFAFCAAFYAAEDFHMTPDVRFCLLFGGIVAFCALVIAAGSFGVAYTLTDEGITRRFLWRRQSLPWAAVRAVKRTVPPYYLFLVGPAGEKLVVSLVLPGSGTTVEHILDHVPPPVLAASDATENLRQLRANLPPP